MEVVKLKLLLADDAFDVIAGGVLICIGMVRGKLALFMAELFVFVFAVAFKDKSYYLKEIETVF